MRLVRFVRGRESGWGVVSGDYVRVLRQAPFGPLRYDGTRIPRRRLTLSAPAEPRTIVLAGLNYRAHARELNASLPAEPVIFLKPVSTLCAPGRPIIYPPGVGRVDHEAELALVIKKTARHIAAANARDYILGYTCLNDVTARELQKKDGQWTRAKSFDTFCPLGPWLETEFSPENAAVRAYVNGILKQDGSTADLIFPVYRLLSYISRIMTLHPGDIISTGTPAGVGPLAPGDEVAIAIEGIGILRNPVRRQPRSRG